MEKSEQSVLRLKEHMDRGTCPKDLRFDAKANIYSDEEFKTDITAIRKEVEQKLLHYRRIERNQDKLRRAKSCKPKRDKHSNRASLTACPQSSTWTNSFPESVQTITANLEKRLQEVNVTMRKREEMNNKTVEANPCLLSE